MSTKSNERYLLFIAFNQNQSCFLTPGPAGYRIYECDPLIQKGEDNFKTGGLIQKECLNNFVALVGGLVHPSDSTNKVIIWNNIEKCASLSLKFESPVKGVRLCQQLIVVVFEHNVKVLALGKPPKVLTDFQTISNEQGICALAKNRDYNFILALPGLQIGQVQLINLSKHKKGPVLIQAHQTALSCLAINLQATRLASASERGTLIRVFDTKSGNMLVELRRGHSQALIYCMNFNQKSTMLVASSNHGTVHVFKLVETPMQSTFSYYMPQYLNSQWSFVKMTLPQGKRSVCAFGPDTNSVVVVCEDGHFYKFGFTTDGVSTLQLHRQIQNITDYDAM